MQYETTKSDISVAKKRTELVDSIKQKMMVKYGKDVNSKRAVEKCVDRLNDKRGNISLDDFNDLEEQIKEAIIRLKHSKE